MLPPFLRGAALGAALLFPLAATVGAAEPALEAGLATVVELGGVNGQALACQHGATAQRIRGLVIQHAPKTLRFGNAFETATSQGFLEQGQRAACPDAAALEARVATLAERLRTQLPAEAQ